MKDLLLIGGGGHCKSVIDSIKTNNEYKIIGILDLPNKTGEKVHDIEIIGIDQDAEYYYKKGVLHAFISLGSIGNPTKRIEAYERLRNIGYILPNIVDQTAIVSGTVQFDEGTFVGKGAIVNAGTRVGKNVIINSGAIIEHDCNLGDYCHIAPGSVISGSVSIGINSHIGTNATIIQNITIGDNTIIGAGSVVIKNILGNVTAFGNPCVQIDKELS